MPPTHRSHLSRLVTAVLAVVTVLTSAVPVNADELTDVTLDGPTQAVLDGSYSYGGVVTEPTTGAGVPATDVEVTVDGEAVGSATTAVDGTFDLTVTFTAYGQRAVHAVANPGTVAESSSAPLLVEVVPPSQDSGGADDIASDTAFLYESADPVQTGVDPSVFEPARTAVVRGRVVDTAGNGLGDVTVTFPALPEYGSTTTRHDGWFDLVVNGGQLTTVRFELDGHLTVEREVHVPQRDYVVVDDVVVVALDGVVTTIDTSNAVGVQVARGSVVSDEHGDRQATLLFQPGTTATMTLPDGTIQQVDTIDVRATEYTVGASGPAAMPAELPPGSGYTYAAEFSVDEAIAADATEVTFDRPVINYLDNFLGFPAGIDVPTGYYDRDLHAWVASDDGIVVDVVGQTDGRADLDTDGDGLADDGARYDQLQITDEERTTLAGLYAPGKSLWRVLIPHFTPWDHNFPYGPPSGAQAPTQRPPVEESSQQCEQPGSIIGCDSQTLGETLGIPGTPFFLRYDSARADGFDADRTVRIPLTGAEPPADLKAVTVTIDVAGRRFTGQYDAVPNLAHRFSWDGVDAYGRAVDGATTAQVDIGYVYDAVYYQPGDFQQSFGRFGTTPITGSRTRSEVTLHQRYETTLGRRGNIIDDIGGWTLSALHAYDVDGRTLHLGGGGRRAVDAVLPHISTYVGTGDAGPYGEGTFTGDGGPASDAGVSRVSGIAVAADGLYLADTDNARIRHVDTAGVITTIAGGGTSRADGIPATQARLGGPVAVDVAADRSVYLVDDVVRRVDPDGIITTFAGGGTPDDGLGDGLPATAADLSAPSDVAVGPNGTIYIADTGHDRIRRVTADGVITTFAGGGSPPDGLGDGLPATQASLDHPTSVTVQTDGSVLVADRDHRRIRRIAVDGTITTIAGNGLYGTAGDGGAATDAQLADPQGIAVDANTSAVYVAQQLADIVRQITGDGIAHTAAGTGAGGDTGDDGPPQQATLDGPSDVAVADNGTLYVADADNFKIKRIAQPLPGFAFTDIVVPSEDGTELYQFDAGGKHLRTLDAISNVALLTFGYDANNRLTTVTDTFGNVTTVERDTSGQVTAIVSEYGLRTEVTRDANANLATVTNPAGETAAMTYHEGGLLATFTTPTQQQHTYTYDRDGRLILDEGPGGSSTNLIRTDTAGGHQVVTTSAEGRKVTYDIAHLSDGSSRRTVTYPSGGTSTTIARPDGTSTVTTSDGVTTTATVGPDPRWGMLAPVPVRSTTTLPSGKTITTTTERTAVLADPLDPLSLTSQVETTTTDGRVSTRAWDATARTLTSTSPQGRVITNTFDNNGLVVRNEAGGLAPISYTYDSHGRLTATTVGTSDNARTATITYTPEGFVDTTTNAIGQATSATHDEIGRPLTATLPDTAQVTYSYDDNGNVTSITPPGQPVHSFTYTPDDLPETYTAPDVGTPRDTTTSYDLDRMPTLTTMPSGRTIAVDYDTAGRPVATTTSRGTATVTYTGQAHVDTVTSPEGHATTYSYDGDRIVGITAAGTAPGQVTYDLDSSLRRTSRQVAGAAPVAYTFDDDDFPTAAGAQTLTWDASTGLLNQTTLGTTTTAYQHNTFGESAGADVTVNGTSLQSTTISRDKLGRITSRSETSRGATSTETYTYDARGRLDTVTRDGVDVLDVDFDANGNRTAITTPDGTATATFDDQDRITSQGDVTFTHNADGQLTSRTDPSGTTRYVYDETGNLLEVTLPDARVVTYDIDASGRRIGRSVDGAVTNRWLYGDGPAPLAELDPATGEVTAEFVYASRPHVPDHIIRDGVAYRLITDERGSVRFVVDTSTGNVVQELTYDTWGRVLTDTNPGWQPFGYAGGQHDSDTGLTRFGARDYLPETGRFTTKDPLGFQAGTNMYTYVGGDPVNRTDPDGLDWINNVGQFVMGLGDTVTFGASRRVRQSLGLDEIVDYCSGFRTAGEVTGVAVDIATGVKGAIGAARWARTAWRTRQAPRLTDDALRAADDAFSHGYRYDPRIRARGLQDPVGHNFPYSYDDVILQSNPIRQADGSLLYRTPGSINGKDGFFEIAVNPDTGTIFHRTFVGGR